MALSFEDISRFVAAIVLNTPPFFLECSISNGLHGTVANYNEAIMVEPITSGRVCSENC